MGDDGVDDVGDDVLSCPGRYYCFSPTLLPSRRELELNCSRSHPVVCLREIIFLYETATKKALAAESGGKSARSFNHWDNSGVPPQSSRLGRP